MNDAVTHVRGVTRKPWLVVGKGPSSDRIGDVDPRAFHVLTLNDACRLVAPDVAHFVDVEALARCRTNLRALSNRNYPTAVCLPWHPHEKFRPRVRPLDAEDAAGCGVLISYNATTAGKLSTNVALAVVRLRHFSAVGAFNLLGAAGVHRLYTIGVDGGTGYGAVFDPADKLANGRQSFDAQTRELHLACSRWRIEWTKL